MQFFFSVFRGHTVFQSHTVDISLWGIQKEANLGWQWKTWATLLKNTVGNILEPIWSTWYTCGMQSYELTKKQLCSSAPFKVSDMHNIIPLNNETFSDFQCVWVM